MKKVRIVLFSVLMLIGGTPMSAYDFCVDGIYYNIMSSGKTVQVTYRSENSYIGAISIPSTVDYGGNSYAVTSIDGGAFRDCADLTSVELPNSISYIGAYAFEDCSSLTTITIPNSVTNIGNCVFKGCGLTSITIPNSVTEIEYQAFAYCSELSSVTLSEGLKIIGEEAFYYCQSLTAIIIPSSVTEIWEAAFSDCWELSSVTLSEGLKSIDDKAFAYCENLSIITIPSSVTSIGEFVFGGCQNLAEFKVASGSKSFAAEEGVLYNKDMSKLLAAPGTTSGYFEVPQGVTSIGAGAFCETLITSLLLPKGLKTIGEKAFSDCEQLEAVTFPKGLTIIEDYAFYECASLASVTLPEGLLSVGEHAFADCGINEIILPSTLLEIRNGAFDANDLLMITSHATIPPIINMEAYNDWDNTFEIDDVNSIILCVPVGCKEAYANDSQWGKFTRIYDTVAPLPEDILVSGVTLNITELSMNVNESRKITATVTPSDATDATLTWTSSDESVATVVNGIVTAVKEGTAIITAMANDESGVSATCVVTVTASATNINHLKISTGSGDVYDLSGRKVVNPEKGVYIINGKKVYVK